MRGPLRIRQWVGLGIAGLVASILPLAELAIPANATAPVGTFTTSIGSGRVEWTNVEFGDFFFGDVSMLSSTGSGHGDLFDGGGRISICNNSGCQYNTGSFTTYSGVGTANASTMTYQGANQAINGLTVSMSYRMSSTTGMARILVRLDNTSSSDVTRTVLLNSDLGCDASCYLKYQSSSGATLNNYHTPSLPATSTNSFWTIFSDQSSLSSSSSGSDPVASFAFGTSGRGLTPTTHITNSSSTNLYTTFDATVPRNSTRYLMFMLGVGGISTASNTLQSAYDGVQTYFRNFIDLPSDVTSDLTNTQRGQILNWLIAPTVASFTPQTTITNSSSLLYDLQFTESVTGLSASDFSLGGTGSSTCTIGTPSGSGTTYQVQLTGCSPGTVTITLAQNAVSNSSSQTGPATATSAATVTIDQTAPTISSITAPSSSTYIPGTALNFTVNFSESVTVTGIPRLPITVGSTQRYADFTSLTDSKTALFRYTVQANANDVDRDGVALTSPAELNSGSIADLAGNAISNLSFTSPSLSGVRVAQLPGAPTITSINPSNRTLTINFTAPADGGTDITNYQYSSNNGSTFSSFSPADTTTPLVLTNLNNGEPYNIGIRGLTTINGVETFGATSNFIRETPTVVEISAPSFTVTRGTLPGSFKLNFTPVTGAASYTVNVYRSLDSYASIVTTFENYTPGSDLQDGDPRTSCSGATPVCYSIALGHTFKFSITPVASGGYSSSGEGPKSGIYGIYKPSGVSIGSATSGPTGLNLTPPGNSTNPGRSGVIATAYAAASNYTVPFDTTSVTIGAASNFFPLPGGESYTVSLRYLGAVVGDTTWFDSDESEKYAFGIFVLNKPNAPSNLTAERNGSQSIRISWTAATGPYQDYYYATSTNNSDWIPRGNTASDSATITGLTNGTPVYVRVYNYGSGTYARSSDFVLLSGTVTPAGPPTEVATANSSGGDASISLSWTAPSNNGGSAITGYLIEYSAGAATYTESITALSTDTRLTLTGLVNGTSYYVRIKAINEVGAGAAVVFGGGSAILVQGTAGSIVGAVTSITGTTATISATINARGNTTTPTLRWGLAGGSQTDVTLSSVTADNVVVTSNLTGLLPGRRYQVTSTTSPGISQDVGGRPIYFTTTPSAISSATSVTTTSSIRVSWAFDEGGNGYGFSYDVVATLDGVSVGAGCQDVTAASGGFHSCEFTGLTANSAYVISITKTITGGDYGNGTSTPYTLTISTDPNIATITLTINGGNLNVQRGSSINIVAATNVAGRVTFRLNGRAIKSCKSKSTVSLSVTCAWRPSVHGTATISALFNPTSNLYTNVTSAQSRVSVIRRTGSRS